MTADTIVYAFIIIAIFFESFMLVTFLSKPARALRGKTLATALPKVAIIVPAWNEETTIGGTVESLLALDYPAEKLSLILVNDGSTDGTPTVIDGFASHPQITALHKENGGKFTAMNLGIEHAADAELIGFLDADSFVASDALKELVAAFDGSEIVAVASSMSIHQPKTLLQRAQYAEFALVIVLRHILASVNGLYVTPGPFSFYRRSVFSELGLFKCAYLAEDMEMALRIQRAGYQIGNALRARVYTKGPPTFRQLYKQRVRWTTGSLRNILFEYRDLLGPRKNPVLGLLVLPFVLIAITGGIFVFVLNIYQLAQSGWHALGVAQAAPLSYLFTWHPLSWSWYDLPISALTLFGVILFTTTLVWMIVGKRLSKTPGKIVSNLAAYLAIYWLIAPLWLIRSVKDVAVGARTTWR